MEHLTDWRMTYIDARNFSLGMFAKAGSLEWCLGYNEKLRPRNKKHTGELPYSMDKVNDIFQYMIRSGIFEDIDHDAKLAAGIGETLQRKMTSYCRQRDPNH